MQTFSGFPLGALTMHLNLSDAKAFSDSATSGIFCNDFFIYIRVAVA